MKGKVCLITGSTAGIGKSAAIGLARMGADLILVGRDPARAKAAKDEVGAAASGGQVELMIADLSSQQQIRKLVQDFQTGHKRLDVLINNAGALFDERQLTEDGIEATFATNHLAYFLLAELMIPLLKQTPGARIVNVASDAHRWGNLDFENLQGEKKYSPWAAYGLSKLANIMFTYELARRLEGGGVTANCMHPGAVRTSLFRDFSGITGGVLKLAGAFFRSPEKGAETIVYLASSPEVDGVSGKYFKDCKPIRSTNQSMDQAAAVRLWEVSERLTHLAAV